MVRSLGAQCACEVRFSAAYVKAGVIVRSRLKAQYRRLM